MRIFIQRVHGPTHIRSAIGGQIFEDSFEGPGLVVLLGWLKDDESRGDLNVAEDWLASKTIGLRIFPDSQGKMNLSLEDYLKTQKKSGGILWVPQFTLAAELESGFRPSFTRAMSPDRAREQFLKWTKRFQDTSTLRHFYGHFGADMNLSFTNWGPVSVPLEK
jgi:D-aminoacyl-tRNA deacylase